MNKLCSLLGVGIIFSSLTFTLPSRADVIIDNLENTIFGTYNSGIDPVGMAFTMPDISGEISSLTLGLNNHGGIQTGTVYLFGASGTGDSALPSDSSDSGIQIGTFSDAVTGNSLVSVTLLTDQPTLLANTSYAIVLEAYTANIEWVDTLSSANLGDGQLGMLAHNTAGTTWRSDTIYGQMNLMVTPVPVPEASTGALMGFGAFIIVGIQILRRKLSAPKAA